MAPCTTGDTTRMSIVVMGVSGSGKSVVGYALAQKIGLEFIDADDLHPATNKEKMSSGIPLTDDDRWPWLDKVGEAISNKEVVIACSALKKVYRDRIRSHAPSATFILLETPRGELEARIRIRQEQDGHFMPASLLDSQLGTLESLGPTERGSTIANQGSLTAVIEAAAKVVGRE